jgi:glutaredoxin 3
MSHSLELYTTTWCPHCAAAREDLEWRGIEYVEYDVEQDAEARARLVELTGGAPRVPVLLEAGKPVRIGWEGRACPV